MALNTLKYNHLTPLGLKGLIKKAVIVSFNHLPSRLAAQMI